MPNASNVQTDFRGGFWSPSVQGRMDDPEYPRGMAECLNAYPLEGGQWTRRPPFRAIGYTRNAAPANLLSLAGATKNQYNMEVSDSHLRFIQGVSIVTDANPQIITNIATTGPIPVVTTEKAHGWANGDAITITLDATSFEFLSSLSQRVMIIQGVTSTTFKVYDLLTGKGLDSLLLNWITGLNAVAARVTDVETPYGGSVWKSVKRVQTDTEVFLLHNAVPMQRLTYDDAGNAAFANVLLEPALLKDGPYLDPVKGSIATPTGTKGLITLDFTYPAFDAAQAYDKGDYVTDVDGFHWKSLRDVNINKTPASNLTYWEKVSALNFMPQRSFSPSDVGRHIRLYSEPPDYVSGGTYADGDPVKFNNQYWKAIAAVTGSGASSEPGADPTLWVPSSTAARWTWGKITGSAGGTPIVPADATGKIGDLLLNGGLGHLFDGVFATQLDGAGAARLGTSAYGGLHLAAPSVITQARVFAAKNSATGSQTGAPGVNGAGTYTFQVKGRASVKLNLRASVAAPTGPSDGTLLGTTATIPYSAITSSAITINSSDVTTATWNYVWVELLVTSVTSAQSALTICASEMQFFSDGQDGGTVTVQLLGDPLLYEEPISRWRLGIFNDTDPTYPVCGCFHQGRLVLGLLNQFVTSKSNDHLNFAPTEPDGTVTEASAINYTLNSKVKAPILGLHSGDNGIVAFTGAGEWFISAPTSDGAISAINIDAGLQSSFGSSDVEPVQAPLTIVFVHSNGRDLYEYMREAYSNRLIAKTLSEYSKSLTNGKITQITFQQGICPIVWGITGDEKLIGTTYSRTSLIGDQPPRFNGWHHHEHGAERAFTSVSVGPGVDPSNEALAAITRDTAGRHRIEVAEGLLKEGNDIFDCNFLDGLYVPASGGTFLSVADTPDQTPPEPPPTGWSVPGWHLVTQCPLWSAFTAGPTGTQFLAIPGAGAGGAGVYITGPTSFTNSAPCNLSLAFFAVPNVPGYAGFDVPAVDADVFDVLQFSRTVFSSYKFFRFQSWARNPGGTDDWTTPVYTP